MHEPRTRLSDDLDHVLRHTTGLWDALRGQRVYLTGGTGFFGSWLLESFCWANRVLALEAEAIVLTRDPEAFHRKAPHLAADAGVRLVVGDVRTFDVAAWRAQLPGPPRDVGFVIHAATDASAALLAEQPLVMVDTVVQGTRATLALARSLGARRFLLTSSGAVYGRQPGSLTHVPESYAGAPDSASAGAAYGEGKRLAETLCACFHHAYGLEATIARCFAFVGPYLPLDSHFAIGNFIRDAARGGAIRVGGDGTPYRSYLYASDLAIWLWTILVRGASVRPYNVGSAHDLTIAQLAGEVSRALDVDAPVQVAATPTPGAEPHRYVPDVTRAATELGLREHVPLGVGIRKTARWYHPVSGT